MRFATPWVLLALLLLPLLFYWGVYGRQRARVRFSALAIMPQGKSWRLRLLHLPLIIRLLAMALLIVGLARPQAGMERIQDISKGVAIEMVVDRSGSMAAEMEFDGQDMNRLQVVKEIFRQFVSGDSRDLTGRSEDLIGMVTFAKYADTICPLTLAHGALSEFLDKIQLVPENSKENRTAIGDAVALAAARLQTAEKTLAKQTGMDDKQYEIKSKIIILLTDGENNAGRHTPEEAAALAAQWGIKIYAIGVGGDSVMRINTLLGPRMVRTRSGVDRKMLKAMADKTDGAFWMAEDADALRQAYKEIDKLEKSEVESLRFLDYKEHFSNFVLLALALLGLEIILRCTLFRRTP